MFRVIALLAVLAVLLPAGAGYAATYEVGPGKPYATLEDVDDMLGPGDLVLLSGGANHVQPPRGQRRQLPRARADRS